MNFQHLIVKSEGPMATIVLNRPEKLNAFEDTMRGEMYESITQVARDPSVRVLILTGAGRAFCAGADVNYLRELVETRDMERARRLVETGREIVRAIRAMDKVVIASVNGPAAGAGANLALACDLRIASREASFSEAFVRVGLHPDLGGTYFLPRLVGLGKAAELMLSGETIDAREAERIGLVNRVVPHEELEKATREVAERFAKWPPVAVRWIKQALNQTWDSSLDEMLELEIEAQVACFQSRDAQEGVRAFLEKREPHFTGE